MSGSARRPHRKTEDLRRLRAKAQARRAEFDAFFSNHLLDVQERLARKCRPYDAKRAALRQQQLQGAYDKELDAQAGYRLGTAGRKPQLWQVEGDWSGR